MAKIILRQCVNCSMIWGDSATRHCQTCRSFDYHVITLEGKIEKFVEVTA